MALLSGTLLGGSLMDLVGIRTGRPGLRVAAIASTSSAAAVGVARTSRHQAVASQTPSERTAGAGLQLQHAAEISAEASARSAGVTAAGTSIDQRAAQQSTSEAGVTAAASKLHQVAELQLDVAVGAQREKAWSAVADRQASAWSLGAAAEQLQLVMESDFRLPIGGGVRADRNPLASSNSLVGLSASAGTDVSPHPLAVLFERSPGSWQIERPAAWSPLAGVLEIGRSLVGASRPIRWTSLAAIADRRFVMAMGARFSPRFAVSGKVWQGLVDAGGSHAWQMLGGLQALRLELAAGARAGSIAHLELARASLAIAVGRSAQLQLAAAVHFQEEVFHLGPQVDRLRLVVAGMLEQLQPRYGVSPIAAAIRAYGSAWSTAQTGGEISPEPLAQLVNRQADEFHVGANRFAQPIAVDVNVGQVVWWFGISRPTRSLAAEYFTRSAARSGWNYSPKSLAQLVDLQAGRIDAGWRRLVATLACSSTAGRPLLQFGVMAQSGQRSATMRLAKPKGFGPVLIAPPDLYYLLADDLIGYELLDRFALYELPSDLATYELLDRFGLYELPADLLHYELLERWPWYMLRK